MRFWSTFSLVALAVVALSAAAPTSGAPVSRDALLAKPWKGTAVGSFKQLRHVESTDPEPSNFFAVEDTQTYRARITFTFRVDPLTGALSGTGRGTYQQATWTAKSVTSEKTVPNCPIPKVARPFKVRVSGGVLHNRATFKLTLLGAQEINKRTIQCDKFKFQATASTYLAYSLDRVQKKAWAFSTKAKAPKIAPRTNHEDVRTKSVNAKPPQETTITRDSSWQVTVKRPR